MHRNFLLAAALTSPAALARAETVPLTMTFAVVVCDQGCEHEPTTVRELQVEIAVTPSGCDATCQLKEGETSVAVELLGHSFESIIEVMKYEDFEDSRQSWVAVAQTSMADDMSLAEASDHWTEAAEFAALNTLTTYGPGFVSGDKVVFAETRIVQPGASAETQAFRASLQARRRAHAAAVRAAPPRAARVAFDPPPQAGAASPRLRLCPDGSYVNGPSCRLCPDGSYAGGQCKLCPDGTYAGGSCKLCPDGTYGGGGRCVLAPGGGYAK